VLNVGNWYHDAIVQVYPKTITPTTVTWNSNNESVATVNPVNGYVYANNPGIAIITARLIKQKKKLLIAFHNFNKYFGEK